MLKHRLTIENDLSNALHAHGFFIMDNFLAAPHYQALGETIQRKYNHGLLKQARIGNNDSTVANTSIRSDKIIWLDDEDEVNRPYFSAIDLIRTHLNQTLFLGLINFEAHFAVYQPGTFYKKHVDQFMTKQDRRISCVYYLNDDWQPHFGGELTLYTTTDQHLRTVEPIANRFVCFSSELPHEVCIAHSLRYSITGWLKTRPL